MSAEGLTGLLRSFRLPTMAAIWQESVAQAERENWGYGRLLQRLCESEEQDRRERKMQRLLKESGLPEGKTLGNLDEKILPAKIRRLLPTLLEGHFVDRAENLLAFGLPGRGKSHFLGFLDVFSGSVAWDLKFARYEIEHGKQVLGCSIAPRFSLGGRKETVQAFHEGGGQPFLPMG